MITDPPAAPPGKHSTWFARAPQPRPTGARAPGPEALPGQSTPAPPATSVETIMGPSGHPEAVKARRWRGRRRLQRQGYVIVEVAVSPAQLRGLHGLGLLSGTPWVRATPPSAEAVVGAISQVLDIADPLSRAVDVLNRSAAP